MSDNSPGLWERFKRWWKRDPVAEIEVEIQEPSERAVHAEEKCAWLQVQVDELESDVKTLKSQRDAALRKRDEEAACRHKWRAHALNLERHLDAIHETLRMDSVRFCENCGGAMNREDSSCPNGCPPF